MWKRRQKGRRGEEKCEGMRGKKREERSRAAGRYGEQEVQDFKIGLWGEIKLFSASPKTETVSPILHSHTNYTHNLMFYCMKFKLKSDKND